MESERNDDLPRYGLYIDGALDRRRRWRDYSGE